MENKKEKTAPDVSVGADTEQPIFKNTTSSISENGGNIKTFEELQREMQLRSDPSYLQTISMNELFDTQYRSKQPLIDGLLYPGTYIFAGSPKLRQASHCTGCNQCNPHCPQSIDIPKELHRIDAYVEQLKQETL